jgi:hypothetical protein
MDQREINPEDLVSRDQPEDEDPFDYNIVPLNIVGTVKVRYKFIGELKPMPYDRDD